MFPITNDYICRNSKNINKNNFSLIENTRFVVNSFFIRMEHTKCGIPSGLLLKGAQKRSFSSDNQSKRKKAKVGATLEDMGVPSRNTGSRSYQDTYSREQIISHRPWEITKKGKLFYRSYGELAHTVCEFSIASYNVLAQNLLVENSYLYKNCDKKYLSWNYRKTQLLNELQKHSPDIICLQEVNEDHYHDFFQQQLGELGYSGAYKKRTGKREDGCATFYKTDKFECQLIYPVEYLMPEVAVLDRDNVALVMLLQPKQHNQTIDAAVCVANTHLLFNPKRGDVKLAQLMFLFAVLDKLVYKVDSSSDLAYHPVVICGDYNMEPYSNLYNFVRGGSLVCDRSIIRMLSGQESEINRGSNRCLEPEFLSKTAGITDQCQYLDIAEQRIQKRDLKTASSQDSSQDETGSSIQVASKISQGSGKITHRLGLRSVYEHVRKSEKTDNDELEVTTYHSNACCTVDYIFYSSAGKREKKTLDGVKPSGGSHLQLVSRLKLLTSEEMKEVGELPNKFNASDHTMLMAKFSFKL